MKTRKYYLESFEEEKDLIVNFDRLRNDYINKVKSNDKMQSLTNENIDFLNRLLPKIGFILARFGRLINVIDELSSYYKKKLSKK